MSECSNQDTVIIDYGMGNLFSVTRVINHLGFQAKVSEDPKVIRRAKRLILPGVGAFQDGMKNLKEKALVVPLKEVVASGTSLLGICLGMQLLMTESEEFGLHQGLDLISGRVVRFVSPEAEQERFKIPHVGWSPLDNFSDGRWKNSILKDLMPGVFMYFVHSYVVVPDEENTQLAQTHYGRNRFCSVIQKKNIVGCQFHPEVSGLSGLSVIKNFLSTS